MSDAPDTGLSAIDGWLMAHLGCSRAGLPAAVRREQLARLCAALEHGRAHSPFYRRHLGTAVPACLDDLALLPFMDASHLSPWEDLLCVSRSEVARLVSLATSGSSGPPKRLAFTLRDLEATMDFFRAGMSPLIKPGETLLVLLPGAERPYGVADLLRRALSRDGIRVEAGDPAATLPGLIHDLSRFSPSTLVAAPCQWLPHALRSPAVFGPLRGILSSAEPLPQQLPDFPFLLLDHYGLTESAYGGGVECPAHQGYHLRELDLLIEIVDVASGKPLLEGQLGEIVLTTLSREAMPLFRYRTGDASRFLPPPCGCGSPLRRLAPVQGRIIRHGSSFSVQPLPKGTLASRSVPLTL